MYTTNKENELFERRDLGNGLIGDVRIPVTKQDQAHMQWTGGKIPFATWQAVLAFFEKSYEVSKSETQVRLFYNADTRQWRAWAFPQEYGTGMTAHELRDAESWDEQVLAAKDGGEFYEFGSVHHHCSAGAFQSGTDRADEAKRPGLHITVGNLDADQFSLHARISVATPGKSTPDAKIVYYPASHGFYHANLTEWFEAPEQFIQPWMPDSIRDAVFEHLLTCPTKGTVEFPEQWMDNLIKRPLPVRHVPAVRVGKYPLGHGWGSGHGNGEAKNNNNQPPRLAPPIVVEEDKDWEEFDSDAELQAVVVAIDALTIELGVPLSQIYGVMEMPEEMYEQADEDVHTAVQGLLDGSTVRWSEVIDYLWSQPVVRAEGLT